MITHELERAAKAYLIAVTGQLAQDGGGLIVDGSGFSFAGGPTGLSGYVPDALSIQIANDGFPVGAGQLFRFYLAENPDKKERPCAIISSESGDVDTDTGNETCQLVVSVEGTASPYTNESDPLETVEEITEAILNALKRDDAADYLNLYRSNPERFTVIGISERQHSKSIVEDHVSHQIMLTCYCAGMDLAPTLPVQS